ncbi:unnamed protein product [Lymnaea stagnalis]|uniref:Immunoglobulin subtype domain-containing protein n=1 Tax=Lymnaea stagnalis TaxID=6523 RepID=A0AAV2HGB0_LYMST
MKHFYIFWLNVFVFGGQSVVDKTTVVEGQTFNITCDHLHVNGTIPSCRLVFLDVKKSVASQSNSIIISLPLDQVNKMPSHWTRDCKNPKANVDATKFQCKIIVKEAKLSDSGRYVCAIGVLCGEGHSTNFEGLLDVVVLKVSETTTKSEASNNFGEKTITGLCLMMIALIQR